MPNKERPSIRLRHRCPKNVEVYDTDGVLLGLIARDISDAQWTFTANEHWRIRTNKGSLMKRSTYLALIDAIHGHMPLAQPKTPPILLDDEAMALADITRRLMSTNPAVSIKDSVASASAFHPGCLVARRRYFTVFRANYFSGSLEQDSLYKVVTSTKATDIDVVFTARGDIEAVNAAKAMTGVLRDAQAKAAG